MKFEEFCAMMNTRLASLSSREERLEEAASTLCRVFGANPDEIAIFSLDAGEEILTFLWPRQLKSAGVIPISAITPLVAQTVRENRGYIDNQFANTSHASFFEKFKIDNAVPLPIQKIMSVPLRRGNCLCGAIQVSRKGEDAASVGRDFSQRDLEIMQKISDALAEYL